MTERKGPDVPDGFDLSSDGTILLHIDNERWRLRRPKLGEYRKIREWLRENEDEHRAIIAGIAVVDRPGEDATQDDKTAYLTNVTARSRDITDRTEAMNVAWVAKVIGMLSDKDAPDVDDLPAGCQSGEFVGSLVEHWRSVPLRSGGS